MSPIKQYDRPFTASQLMKKCASVAHMRDEYYYWREVIYDPYSSNHQHKAARLESKRIQRCLRHYNLKFTDTNSCHDYEVNKKKPRPFEGYHGDAVSRSANQSASEDEIEEDQLENESDSTDDETKCTPNNDFSNYRIMRIASPILGYRSDSSNSALSDDENKSDSCSIYKYHDSDSSEDELYPVQKAPF